MSAVRPLALLVLWPLLALTPLACRQAPPPVTPVRLTIGAAVPLSGPDTLAGEQLVRGVRLAVGETFAVLVVDDTQPGAADNLARLPEVVGVVAHVGASAAERQIPDWKRVALPVVIGAPGSFAGIARVVPPADDLAACAATLLGEGPYFVRTDGEPASTNAAHAFVSAAPGFSGEVALAAGIIPIEAAKLQRSESTVVWLGDPAFGGNFLHALRALGSAPFFGVSAHEPAFLRAAGGAADGARVTSVGRPALDPSLRERYQERYGEPATGVAVVGYDAARLLIAAYETAHARDAEATGSAVRDALGSVQTTGSAGPMFLDPEGVLQPVTCQSWRVEGAVFVPDRAGQVGGAPVDAGESAEPGAEAPVPAAPAKRRPRKKEGEWLGIKPGK